MAENQNLRLWTRFADIDPQHTKAITGKPYKGTSPKPQYIIQLLTEMFGPVGQGFGWNVVAEGFTPLGDEVLHWCRIKFWWAEKEAAALDTNIFEAYGQTKALMKTKSGLMMDEDAPKKSLTDAITKAASQIGIASNLFMGRWDDSRYVEQVDREFRRAEREEAQAAKTAPKPDAPKAPPLVDQMGPQPTPQEPAPPLTIATVRRGCLKNIAKAPDLAELQRMEGSPLFEGYLNRLQAEDREGWLEVCAALEERRAALMPPDLDDGIPERLGGAPIPLPPRLQEAMDSVPGAFRE